jgi:hypothetical protein
LLLTKSHNERTLAFQQDIENRKLMAEAETDKRLALDTAVKGLELLVADGGYAPKARIAGALGSLVHLGHPVIAMRALSAAWDDGAVDNATACWLIGEVLKGDSGEASREASILLRRHANKLPRKEEDGASEWPLPIQANWPSNVPADVRWRILQALAEMLLSRERAWWGDRLGWVVILIHEAFRHDPSQATKDFSAGLLRILLSIEPRQGLIGWRDGSKSLAEMHLGVSNYQPSYRLTGEPGVVINRLEAWAKGGGQTHDSV